MSNLPELSNIKELQKKFESKLKTSILAEVKGPEGLYPIIGFVIGPDDPTLPTLALFGGVHGLERIGTHIVTEFLNAFLLQLEWDQDLQETIKHMRIVSIPLVNPAGMAMIRRSNPRGVDLNRNSPTNALTKVNLPFLISGHRYSNKIPWYRGELNSPLEIESSALINFVEKELLQSEFAISVDFHSGFGLIDRLWYPYAKTTENYPKIHEVLELKNFLDQSMPHHIYKIEAQSKSYTTHGDLWDHMFDMHFNDPNLAKNKFIPLTLELGSWNWVKKNPKQLFSLLGMFNPIVSHRFDRSMRRHKPLLEFLLRAVRNHKNWNKK